MKKIYYLVFYDLPNSEVKRNYPLSAATKANYMISVFERAGYNVACISAAIPCTLKLTFHNRQQKIISNNVSLEFFSAFSGTAFCAKVIKKIWNSCSLMMRLLKLTRNDTLVVYHSIAYQNIVILAKIIKNFKLVLELNEIYSDVTILSGFKKVGERKIISIADTYIFSTHFLNERVNAYGKPYTINHGTYNITIQQKGKRSGNTINVVYAGTLDPTKGALAAVAAAAYLPSNYKLHILGFGNKYEIELLENLILSINNKGKAQVIFHGTKEGLEFERFLQCCDIGLSTQNPDSKFNSSSFPSKILTYMANGLRVVTIDIPAIKDSKVGPYLSYYSTQTPKALADAIMESESNIYNSQEILIQLDSELKKELRNIL